MRLRCFYHSGIRLALAKTGIGETTLSVKLDTFDKNALGRELTASFHTKNFCTKKGKGLSVFRPLPPVGVHSSLKVNHRSSLRAEQPTLPRFLGIYTCR